MSSVQEDAPYPADLEHLDEILALSDLGAIPEGATDIAVTPAVKFAESYPTGWGYVVSYRADDEAIRRYVDDYTSHNSAIIDKYPASLDEHNREDLGLTSIENPWVTTVGNTTLVFERPLGRGWLQVLGSAR